MKHTVKALTATVIISWTLATAAHADYYKDGIRFYVRKNYGKAREYLLKAVEQKEYGNAYYFLGEIERNASNFTDAERYYELAVSSKSISRGYLKNAYWNLMAFAERVQDHRKVVRICKGMSQRLGDRSARRKIESIINKYMWTDNAEAIEKYRQGVQQKQEGQYDRALRSLSDALSIDGSFMAPRFEIGMISYRQGNMDRALSNLSAVAERIDFYAEVHLILGDIYFSRNSYGTAVSHLNRAEEFGLFDRGTEYLIRTKRGTCLYQMGDNDRAMEDFRTAMRLDSKGLQPYIMIAAIQMRENRYDEAKKMLARANAIQPNNPVILFQMGSIYYKEDDSRYLSYFDRTFDHIKEREHYSEKYDRMVSLLMANHFKNQNYGRVAEILGFIPEQRLRSDTILIAAKTYFGLKDYDRSIDYFEKISLGGDDRFTLALAYARSGRKEKAKEALTQLIREERFRQKARGDRNLAPLMREIEAAQRQSTVPER
ncbi:MAG: tetratricopeptide repeat protein [Spirochaetes bacterium]|nr:tetratricopeptide repeat protein [Spirochaetota bacterium]